MFSKTTLFIVFCSVVAVSIAARVSYISEDEDDRGFWENAKNKLKEYLEKIKNTAKSGFDQLKELANEFKAYLVRIKDDAKAEINGKFKEILDQLQAIKDKAKQKGQDISPCLEGREDQLKHLPLAFIDGTVSCVDAKVTEGLDIVKKTVDDVNAILKKSDGLKQEFNDCGTCVTCIPCMTKVLAKIAIAIIKDPADIVKDVAKAVKYGVSLKKSYKVCLTEGGVNVVKKGAIIIKDITVCIAKLPQ